MEREAIDSSGTTDEITLMTTHAHNGTNEGERCDNYSYSVACLKKRHELRRVIDTTVGWEFH